MVIECFLEIFCQYFTFTYFNDPYFNACSCASDIKEVRDSCLNGLVTMLSNRDGNSFVGVVFFIFWYRFLTLSKLLLLVYRSSCC